ncbi:MAG: hypothetical protein RIR26_2051 [Pseudomonadota bacterium]|jgi:lipoate-protein ligase A
MWMDNWVLNQPFRSWPTLPEAPAHHRILFRFFESQRPLVVLSSSNSAEVETYEAQCSRSGVPVVQRRGGGGTVVLGPGCLILTFAFYGKDLFSNQKYFSLINQMWADAMASAGVAGLVTRGHSDLAFGERKIAGTSLFRRKHLVVYQGSLLVHPDFDAIASLLKHPSREPDYRQGRSHEDFLISAKQLGYEGTVEQLARHCTAFIGQQSASRLAADFAEPSCIPSHQR